MTSTPAERVAQAVDRPLQINGMRVRNRTAMAPMTRRFSPAGIPGEDVADYYERRAAGGVGLIITEGTYVERDAAGAEPDVPCFYGPRALAGWARVADQVHSAGGRIVPQLWHVGVQRPADSAFAPGAPAEGPSGVGLDGSPSGREMTGSDIDETVRAFAEAAAAAQQNGFDGVELHGAHGYLIDDFLWHSTNRRTDGYGGDHASRTRFAAEIVAAVRAAVTPEFPVLFRFSQWKADHYGARIAESPQELEEVLTPLAEAGVDAFHASTRRYWLPEFDDSDLNLAGWTKKITGRTTLTVGSVGLDKEFNGPQGFTPQAGVAGIDLLLDRLERDEFDAVAIGRALLADPDWVRKALAGKLDQVKPYDAAEALHVLS
ncbi:NADH:flavin oxidoreductase [Saccharopolyspora sp. HNM0983]|uniref:NADH:flavin oxidoreductase n=1 Tax=Saccharopolyspora montiporae TaxID=2781240 RepID=A0A929BAS5_9PSEU|nr:NADH:flavin oxidoreductase [Saccharopolyspora sp. HNM0983]MBE9376469.1 NADH:flavin oxidoreductase [Saccharopolyspora sp. HNM0983]